MNPLSHSLSKSLRLLVFALAAFSGFFSSHAGQFYEHASVPLPEADRVIHVGTDSELKSAINHARPGDRIVLADGDYDGLNLVGLKGSSGSPIVFAAANERKARISGTVKGRNMRLSDCAHLEFHGIRFTAASTWSVTMGPAFTSDTSSYGCHHIRIVNCEIDTAGQTLLKVNGNSSHIDIIGNHIHHSGMSGSGKPYAEGVYLGDGGSGSDRSHDILIQGNHIHDIGNSKNWGEAIDMKVKVYNVTVADNLIEHVTVNSQGAVTVLIDDGVYPSGGTNPNILIERNVIHDVRRRSGGWNGSGIAVGSNGVTIRNNVIWDTDESSVTATKDAANTTGLFSLIHNTFHDGVIINKGSVGHPSGSVSPILVNNAIRGGGGTSKDYAAQSSDFVGPLAGDASNGGYVGAGFRLAESSPAIGRALILDEIDDDVSGASRPSSERAMGAFDFAGEADVGAPSHPVAYLSGGGGRLSGPVEQTVAEGGPAEAVTAVPDPGFRFAGWEGSITSGENPLRIDAVTTPMELFARFVEETSSETPDAGGGRVEPELIVAINSGGPKYVASDGMQFDADGYYVGGRTSARRASVDGTEDDFIFHSIRFGDFEYEIPVAAGKYRITLMLSEVFWSRPGMRMMDIFVEDTIVADDLDLYAEAGKHAAYPLIVEVDVTDGLLDLDFVTEADNASVCGIVVERLGATSDNEVSDPEGSEVEGDTPEADVPEEVVDSDRLPDDWEIEHFGGISAENGGEDDDYDGDGRSNYEEWLAGTDPTDANDFLELEPVIGVAWKSVEDRSYAVEYSDDDWKTFETSEVIEGTGEELVWLDADSRDVVGNRQYRVIVSD